MDFPIKAFKFTYISSIISSNLCGSPVLIIAIRAGWIWSVSVGLKTNPNYTDLTFLKCYASVSLTSGPSEKNTLAPPSVGNLRRKKTTCTLFYSATLKVGGG